MTVLANRGRKRNVKSTGGGPKVHARRKVGFYGCNRQVVRVMKVGKHRYFPQHVRLQCPACTHEHTAKIMWRPFDPEIDRGKDYVVV